VYITCEGVINLYRPNACVRGIVLKKISAVPNRFTYRQNAYFRDIVFKLFCEFQIVSNIVKLHALDTLPLVAIHYVLIIW